MEKKEPKKRIVRSSRVPRKHAALHRSQKNEEEMFEIDEGLKAIYGEEPQDLHIVERGASPLSYWLPRIVAMLGFIAIFVLGIFFLLSRGIFWGENYAPLEMTVNAPSEAKSGEMMTIEIPYKNPENVPLATFALDVNLPASFQVLSSTPAPTNEEEMVYTIGSLGPRSDGVLKIEGLWLAENPSTTNIQVIANYRPSNFNSEFSEIASASVSTTGSVITEEISGPATASPGEVVTYTVKVKHEGEISLDNVDLAMTFPEGFILSSSTPPLEGGSEPVFHLGTLAPQSEITVSLVGSYSSEVSDVQQVSALAQINQNSSSVFTQAKTVWLTDVKGGNLRLSLVANGLTGTVAAEPGEMLRLSFRIENAGETPMPNASVLIDFQPGAGIPISWSSATLDGGVLTADGVKFDAAKIGILEPGGKKTFNLSFPVKSTISETDLDVFTVVARASTGTSTLFSTPITVNVNAWVAFAAQAHYYSTDGAPIGEGPMPPKVNETTTYEMMWIMEHALHPLESMVVTATLPPGVVYAGNAAADSGAITYDEATRTVRLDVAALPAERGKVHAKFFIDVTPGDEDVDTYKKILSGSSLRVTDSETGERIDRSIDALTTELPSDSFASGKGLVTE